MRQHEITKRKKLKQKRKESSKSHSIITETLAKDYGNTRKDQSDSG